jgi:hypothetical protein
VLVRGGVLCGGLRESRVSRRGQHFGRDNRYMIKHREDLRGRCASLSDRECSKFLFKLKQEINDSCDVRVCCYDGEDPEMGVGIGVHYVVGSLGSHVSHPVVQGPEAQEAQIG